MSNPFHEAGFAFFHEEEAKPKREPEVRPAKPRPPLITAPGAYENIDQEIYHAQEICDEPSVSSSGLKTIEGKSPFHYWQDSPLNPHRRQRDSKAHFAIGHLLHDILAFGGALPDGYHIVPDDFVAKHTVKWAEELPAYRAAVDAGKDILKHSEFEMGVAMAEAVEKHELARALLTAGTPEITLVARDPKTNRYMRARPDILPHTMEIIPDVKTAVTAHPEAYEKAATKFGYWQTAAHYLDVLDLLYGEEKRRFVHIVIEKGSPQERHYPAKPYIVEIYHLDDGDIHYGRMLNRRALNLFDHCLKTGEWPAYSGPDQPILPLQMASYARARIDRRIELGELSYDL